MTTVEPNDLLLFARVADEGSFSAAAQRLGLPKSTVSRRLAGLESRLGERLLLRTTRKLSLTDFGQHVLEHARQVALEAEAAAALAQHRQAEPSGRLRVSMPPDLATGVMTALLARFAADYPAITLELDLSPRRVDLVGENFDLALRIGELADDATLAARQIASFSVGLYAAPDYLRRRGVPEQPDELPRHDSLRLLLRSGEFAAWPLVHDDDPSHRWQGSLPCRASANSPELLTQLAAAGLGIAAVADHYAAPHVSEGRLLPVLPAWSLPPAPAWAVFPGRRLMPARTRVFLDALAAEFSGPACAAAAAKFKGLRRGRVAAADLTRA